MLWIILQYYVYAYMCLGRELGSPEFGFSQYKVESRQGLSSIAITQVIWILRISAAWHYLAWHRFLSWTITVDVSILILTWPISCLIARTASSRTWPIWWPRPIRRWGWSRWTRVWKNELTEMGIVALKFLTSVALLGFLGIVSIDLLAACAVLAGS